MTNYHSIFQFIKLSFYFWFQRSCKRKLAVRSDWVRKTYLHRLNQSSHLFSSRIFYYSHVFLKNISLFISINIYYHQLMPEKPKWSYRCNNTSGMVNISLPLHRSLSLSTGLCLSLFNSTSLSFFLSLLLSPSWHTRMQKCHLYKH